MFDLGKASCIWEKCIWTVKIEWRFLTVLADSEDQVNCYEFSPNFSLHLEENAFVILTSREDIPAGKRCMKKIHTHTGVGFRVWAACEYFIWLQCFVKHCSSLYQGRTTWFLDFLKFTGQPNRTPVPLPSLVKHYIQEHLWKNCSQHQAFPWNVHETLKPNKIFTRLKFVNQSQYSYTHRRKPNIKIHAMGLIFTWFLLSWYRLPTFIETPCIDRAMTVRNSIDCTAVISTNIAWHEICDTGSTSIKMRFPINPRDPRVE